MEEIPQKNYPNIAQSFGLSGIMVLTIIVGSAFLLLKDYLDKELLTLLMHMFAVGIPCWIGYTIRKKKTGIDSFNLVIENKRIIPYLAIGAVFLLVGIISPISSLIPMPEAVEDEFMKAMNQYGIFSFVLMVLSAPILEELLFRGIILDGLLKKQSPVKAILISSLLFGLVHLNPWQFVTGMIMGIFIGWVYYHTRSLLAAMIIHAAANFSGYLARFFIDIESMKDMTTVELYGGVRNYALMIAGSVLVVSACVYLLHKEFEKSRNKSESQLEAPITI